MTCTMRPPEQEQTETEQETIVVLSRDSILEADDSVMELVDVPEWGGSVYVRGIGARERDKYENECLEGRGKNREFAIKNVRARLCVLAVCNEAGERLFKDTDANRLGQKSAAAVDRVFDVAQRLGGFTDADVEELAKNLDETPGDSTPMD